MPLKPTSIIPALVEQIFARYSELFDEQRRNNTFSKQSYNPLFIELDAIFSDDLKLALRILDEQVITIYTTDKSIHEIAEITEGRQAKRVVKLFSNINYCQCTHFLSNVLHVESTENIPASSSTCTSPSAGAARYTCHHVLALRLANLLQAPCIRTETLPNHKINFILKQINPTDCSAGGDILNTIAQYLN